MTTHGNIQHLASASDGVLIRLKVLDEHGKPLPGPATGEIELKSASVGHSLIKRELADPVVSVSLDTNPPHLRNLEKR